MLKKSLTHYLLFSVLFFAGINSTNFLAAQDATGDTTAEASADAGGVDEFGIPSDQGRISEGESIFKANCRSCHKVHEKLVGPALANVWERAPSMEWIVSFIHNSQKVIQSGEPYAVALYEEYNQTQMTAFPTLSEEQIYSVLAYVKDETIKGPEVAAPAETAGGETAVAQDAVPSFYLNAILIGLVVVLVLILFVLVLITTILRKYIMQKGELTEEEEEIVTPKRDYGSIVKSPQFIFIVVFIFTAVAFKAVINGLFSVGVQLGYAPEQPIAFSHELHAGTYEIDCQYCHTGVRISKSANIPSANICMNCHKYVLPESPQIQKIWAAVDYQAETDTYGPNQKPIEWIRVHNIPDLAYFNHAQHVNVGGLDCENCHGDVTQMAVIKQTKLLTMGWCIDCHRETNVNSKGNDYYDKLVEIHEGEEMKVEDIGGLECSKCHY